jgi:intraflagellar transport protein 52
MHQDVIFQFLIGDLTLNAIDASDPELSDAHTIPDHVQLSSQMKVCLQEGELEMPTNDFTKLFDASLHAMDLALWPKCIRCGGLRLYRITYSKYRL